MPGTHAAARRRQRHHPARHRADVCRRGRRRRRGQRRRLQAIARLEAEPPDIVLADIGMPGKDGYDVAHAHAADAGAGAHSCHAADRRVRAGGSRARARSGVRRRARRSRSSRSCVIGRVKAAAREFESAPGAAAADLAARLKRSRRCPQVRCRAGAAAFGGRRRDRAAGPGSRTTSSGSTARSPTLAHAGSATPPDSTRPAAVCCSTNVLAVSGRAQGSGNIVAGDDIAPAIEPEPSRPTASTGVETPMLQRSRRQFHERHGWTSASPPALRDAFTALLAMEQGHPLPKAAGGRMPAVDAA